MIILQIILLLIGSYLLFYSLFWLVLTLFSIANRGNRITPDNKTNPEILLIFPAYKPGPVFIDVLKAAEKAIHGRDIKVFILLQEAEAHYEFVARSMGFYVQNRSFTSLGGNSYQHALRYICDEVNNEQRKGAWNPEFVMLVDKDNLLALDFFDRIPDSVYNKFDVIQGRRKSLETNTAIAFFDSMTEALNDAMFRSAKQNVGGMIEISGSGALIETDLFVDSVYHLDPNAPGFDKNFMVQILTSQRDVRTTFWPDSELKEEKTSDLIGHNPQRTRWFGEQYYNALYHGKSLLKAFRKYRRFAALDYLVTLWRPPRSVQVMILPALSMLEIGSFLYLHYWPAIIPVFTMGSILMMLAIVLFLMAQGAFKRALRYGVQLPVLAFNNLFNAALSVRKENRGKFIHTPHKL